MKKQLWYSCAALVIAGAFALSTPAQQKKQPADLIIASGTVVTMDADRRILEDGAIRRKRRRHSGSRHARSNRIQILRANPYRRKGPSGPSRLHQRPHPCPYDAPARPQR